MVPSLKLVIVRTGREGGSSIFDADNYIARLTRLTTEAAAARTWSHDRGMTAGIHAGCFRAPCDGLGRRAM